VAVAPSHFDEAPLLARGLYERHATALRGFCRQRSANQADAEEALQATFLRALSAMRAGVRPREERAWLLTIARNVCATQATRAHRRHEVALEPAMLETQAAEHSFDRSVDPDLIAALEGLPEGQRRAFVLRAVDGLSYHEIANELGVSHAAVETWIFRARRKLAAAVSESRSRLAHATSLVGAAKSLFAGSATLKATAAASLAIATLAGAAPAIRDRLDDRGTTQIRQDRDARVAPDAPGVSSSTPTPTRSQPQGLEPRGPSRGADAPAAGRTMLPRDVPSTVAGPVAPPTSTSGAPPASTSPPQATTPTTPPTPVDEITDTTNQIVEPVVELVDPLVTPVVEVVEGVAEPLPEVPPIPLPLETPTLELPDAELPPLLP
jgi:RNA polymerase sigma factor (sigma-70 family)